MNDTYEATGEMYNRVIGHLLGSNSPELPYVVVATHNEKGVWDAIQKTLGNLGAFLGDFLSWQYR